MDLTTSQGILETSGEAVKKCTLAANQASAEPSTCTRCASPRNESFLGASRPGEQMGEDLSRGPAAWRTPTSPGFPRSWRTEPAEGNHTSRTKRSEPQAPAEPGVARGRRAPQPPPRRSPRHGGGRLLTGTARRRPGNSAS